MTTTTARTSYHATKLLLAALLAALVGAAALLAGAGAASAAPAASFQATSTCWQQVINDWLDNNQVDRVYAIPCYTQAIQHLNAYPDVQNYSSATDDIQRALLAAIRQDRGNGPGAGAGPTGPSTGGGGPASSGSNGGGGPAKPSSSGGVLGALSPSDAQSIPLPLLVLGGLALLLLAAAGATLVARRIQARRMTPVPVRTPAVDKRT
jgi:hypothetical protein